MKKISIKKMLSKKITNSLTNFQMFVQPLSDRKQITHENTQLKPFSNIR
jgi:hypothetical protein